MSLTDEQVRTVARLARLGLDGDQITEYASDLSSIVGVFATLEKADTDTVEPMAHPLDLSARLRADTPAAVTERDVFQALAPDTQSGVYRVPKVIE